MRKSLVGLAGLLVVGGCAMASHRQYDRPDPDQVLEVVRKGHARSAVTADGRTLDLSEAVTAGRLVCAASATPACFPAASVTALESFGPDDPPWWAYAVAAPLAPVVLVGEATEGLDRALTGGPQTFTPSWAADALPQYNPCIRHVRREGDGGWPSDQIIRADLYHRRAELSGGCLVRLGAEYAFPVATRRRLHLTGQVRQRFEAFACVQRREAAEAEAPRVFVPRGAMHTDGREVGWPSELRRVLDDPRTWAVTADLTEACANAGGVAPDLSSAIARAREGWPLPAQAG
ncbi:MAG: hypothetical protein EON87_09030 [Brevundimonas sp.]|nr:MAG: hypothetical protein EON87_09030 [Brevundimonas sp.]